MLNDLDADYELLNDIDMTGFTWQPIGAAIAFPFTGTFDGRYYTISNLTVVANAPPAWANVGLFGRIGAGAVARRTILTNVTVTITHRSSSKFALFAGSVYGTVTDCYAQGTIRRTVTHTFLGGAGGFTGLIGEGGTIARCGAEVGMTSAIGVNGAGGFVGGSTGVGTHTITDCYVIGTIDGSEHASDRRINNVGGFIEQAEYLNTPDHHIIVTNCYCVTQIKGKENASPSTLGGFIGTFTIGVNGDADEDFNACFWDNDVDSEIEDRTADLDLFDCGRLWSTEDEGNLPADEILKSTTGAMYQQATFTDAGWDFTDDTGVWRIDEGSDYPRHQWIYNIKPNAYGTLTNCHVRGKIDYSNSIKDGIGFGGFGGGLQGPGSGAMAGEIDVLASIEEKEVSMREEEKPMIEETYAEVSEAIGVQSFKIPNKITIPSDKNPHPVNLSVQDLEAEKKFYWSTMAPENVIVMDKLKNGDLLLLAGNVKLYFMEEFLGETSIPLIAPKEEFKLGTRVSYDIKIDKKIIDRSKAKKAIKGKLKNNYSYKIVIKNLNEVTEQLTILDRIPHSSSEKIKVEIEEIDPEPDKKELGILKWKISLEDVKEKTISYKYHVEYKQGITITPSLP